MADIIQKKERLKEVSKLIQNIDIDNLTPDQFNGIAKLLIIDNAKKKMDQAVKKDQFNYNEKKDLFLKNLKTDNTRKIYNRALKVFEKYLQDNNLSVLDCTAFNIDSFISSLKEISNSTARLIIAGCSKFFSMLKRWDVIDVNYFLGCDLPKRQRTRELKVINDDDYQAIIKTFDRPVKRGIYKSTDKIKHKWRVIFRLLYESGLRISAIKTITFKHGNIITYISKGKTGSLQLDSELIKELKTTIDLKSITENSIQQMLKLACKRAGLKTIYNCHSFRHAFAIREYSKNHDIYRLKNLLNHANIGVTENYLKSLKLIE
ncbi:MAG: tyrosine-type recombinase/integrase [Spirochaetes bacterium]|nr:tyrosine-type recombinase/integrase [Spirochaetota bacterium]